MHKNRKSRAYKGEQERKLVPADEKDERKEV